jgi:hypothetical protein
MNEAGTEAFFGSRYFALAIDRGFVARRRHARMGIYIDAPKETKG